MKMFILLFLFISTASAETKLLLIGGGKRPVEAMRKFSQYAGSDKASILIIPWASESTEGAENIKAELLNYSNANIVIAPMSPTASFKSLLNQATGVFFTGGDQNTLMKIINSQSLKNVFKQKFENGIIFAGTSAGTAIMSERMLTGEGDLTVLDGSRITRAEGLGLLPSGIIVDQHFIVRSRFNRLAGAVLLSQESGLAIDESTSLLILDSKAQVIGPTQVMTFKPKSDKKLMIDIYANGESFDL